MKLFMFFPSSYAFWQKGHLSSRPDWLMFLPFFFFFFLYVCMEFRGEFVTISSMGGWGRGEGGAGRHDLPQKFSLSNKIHSNQMLWLFKEKNKTKSKTKYDSFFKWIFFNKKLFVPGHPNWFSKIYLNWLFNTFIIIKKKKKKHCRNVKTESETDF